MKTFLRIALSMILTGLIIIGILVVGTIAMIPGINMILIFIGIATIAGVAGKKLSIKIIK